MAFKGARDIRCCEGFPTPAARGRNDPRNWCSIAASRGYLMEPRGYSFLPPPAAPWLRPTVSPARSASRQIGAWAVVAGRNRMYHEDSTLETEMATGTVKWFNPTKGYGFIQPTGGGGKDVFVHISAVEQAGLSTLNEGQSVEYELESNRGKESAVKLKVK
jgi:CspA family cold shock protein